jgi:hypothetical protein
MHIQHNTTALTGRQDTISDLCTITRDAVGGAVHVIELTVLLSVRNAVISAGVHISAGTEGCRKFADGSRAIGRLGDPRRKCKCI